MVGRESDEVSMASNLEDVLEFQVVGLLVLSNTGDDHSRIISQCYLKEVLPPKANCNFFRFCKEKIHVCFF